eukprot:90132-Chlamydomonas_euryale.AAC.1
MRSPTSLLPMCTEADAQHVGLAAVAQTQLHRMNFSVVKIMDFKMSVGGRDSHGHPRRGQVDLSYAHPSIPRVAESFYSRFLQPPLDDSRVTVHSRATMGIRCVYPWVVKAWLRPKLTFTAEASTPLHILKGWSYSRYSPKCGR